MGIDSTTPVEVTDATVDAETDDDIINCFYNSVKSVRGLGQTGYRLETTDHECDECGFDRTVREKRYHPDDFNRLKYYCLNPACQYYVADTFNYASPNRA